MNVPFLPQIRLYQDWLREHRGLEFDSYEALRHWSVTDLDAFWQYWRQNGVPHKHGYYESTWGAINQALRYVGVVKTRSKSVV